MRRIRPLMILVLIIVLVSYAPAAPIESGKGTVGEEEQDRQEVQKYWEALKRSDPERYRLTIQDAQMKLAQFGYGIRSFTGALDEQTRRALREYQQYNNLAVTGDLGFPTWEKLREDAGALESPISLPAFNLKADELGGRDFLWDQGFVKVRGTWASIGEKKPNPLKLTTSLTHCRREWKMCVETKVTIAGSGIEKILVTDMYEHEIERWDAYEIVTKPDDTCARWTMRINRVQNTMTALLSPSSTVSPCAFKEEQHQLVDGSKVSVALWEARKKAMRRVMRLKQPE